MLYCEKVDEGKYHDLGYVLYYRPQLVKTSPPQYAPVIIGEDYDQKLTGGEYDRLILKGFGTVRIFKGQVQPVAHYEAQLETKQVDYDEIGVFEPFLQTFIFHEAPPCFL